MAHDYDVLVVGGGPAGAVFALLAARDGCRVALIDPNRSVPRSEGMSPRLQGWLQQAGLFDAPAMRAVTAPRSSYWDGPPVQANAELIVDRAAVDAHLRRMAGAADVRVIEGTALPLPGRAEMDGGQGLTARFVIDARGRRAHRARSLVTRGPATIAIGAALKVEAGQGAGSRILPLDQGWLWLAARGDGTAWAQLTLDAADPEGRAAEARLAEGLRAASAGLPLVLGVEGDPLIRDATPVLAAPAEELAVLPIGDAASAMDPLSGHGMFWAVSSALAATAVRRTLMRRDDAETRDLALRFLAQRHADVYPRQARLGRDFIRQQSARLHLPFWSRRAGFPDDTPLEAPAESHIARRIVVEDGVLAEAEVVVTSHSPAGMAWVGPDRAVDLLRKAQADAVRPPR
ncbi:flavin-dependent monooxygenase QhpG [Paracoccus zhejiangensis]|uniref:Pilus assembly protein CpaD n=1 Tax=Paracoccus zhejiangensis TaxID=1077935 RepID=A0A2H5EVQ8_9RHOB|nr:FAD-dependent monooxygenase [Paracoccus zhejiangensis]AUH63388.1 pilus assembly protein CpaD [Paracoccus zhejiangensis]